MTEFKLNQLQEAIFRTLGAKDTRVDELKLRLKRLLVTDRRLGRGKRSENRADRRYAFYSHKPLGSGVEVMFSGYEAFALMAALIVLEHGIPQAKVVSILQAVRSDLEAAHRETLEKDPKVTVRSAGGASDGAAGHDRRRQYCAGVFGICETRCRSRESASDHFGLPRS